MILNIRISSGVAEPGDLKKLATFLPEAGGTEGVIVSGRLPVWAYGAVIHHFHPRPWVATFDPRLGGGVVVASHTKRVEIGDIIPLDGHEEVEITF